MPVLGTGMTVAGPFNCAKISCPEDTGAEVAVEVIGITVEDIFGAMATSLLVT